MSTWPGSSNRALCPCSQITKDCDLTHHINHLSSAPKFIPVSSLHLDLQWHSESGRFSHWVVSVSFAAPWTIAHQAPLSMEFSRQESWSGVLCPSPGDFPTQGSNLNCRQVLYHLSHQGSSESPYSEAYLNSLPFLALLSWQEDSPLADSWGASLDLHTILN